MVRNEQVMIDIDLANIYGIENRSLRQAVRRNIVSGVSQNVIPPEYNTGGAEMFAV